MNGAVSLHPFAENNHDTLCNRSFHFNCGTLETSKHTGLTTVWNNPIRCMHSKLEGVYSLYKEIWDKRGGTKGEGQPCVCMCVSLGRVCSWCLCECVHVSLRGEANLLLCSTARGIQTDRQQEEE